MMEGCSYQTAQCENQSPEANEDPTTYAAVESEYQDEKIIE
jgi:hypothetical protein